MTLTIRFLYGSTLRLESVEQIRLMGNRTIETKTFGNVSILQRNVKNFYAEYDFDTLESYIGPTAADEEDMYRNGDRVKAIRFRRERLGLSLKETKDSLDLAVHSMTHPAHDRLYL